MLDTKRKSVPIEDESISRWMFIGGQTTVELRRLKYAANRLAKNISSDAKKITTPNSKGCARIGNGG